MCLLYEKFEKCYHAIDGQIDERLMFFLKPALLLIAYFVLTAVLVANKMMTMVMMVMMIMMMMMGIELKNRQKSYYNDVHDRVVNIVKRSIDGMEAVFSVRLRENS